MYLLKPTPMVKQVFSYCLAHASQIYNIPIHAYCVMSNHYHLVASDPEGHLPAFMSWFNEFVAKALNCGWGRWEYFWSAGTYSAVRLETLDDVIEKIVYTLTNPVKAYLVSNSARWPGVTSRNVPFNAFRQFVRPQIFFRKDGPLPDSRSLVLQVPLGFDDSPAAFKTMLNRLIAEVEREIKAIAKLEKRGFIGAVAARAINHFDSPVTIASRWKLNPHVASKHGPYLRAAMHRLKCFRNEYAVARQRFDNGDSNVIFPYGTYALRKNVAVQPIPPPVIV